MRHAVAFPCECGGSYDHTVESRGRRSGWVYRVRECYECGDRISTHEVRVGDAPVVAAAAVRDAVHAAVDELRRARDTFPAFNTAHHGWAVIREEVDELWEAVKHGTPNEQEGEAVQVAAMGLRFLVDLHGNGTPDA